MEVTFKESSFISCFFKQGILKPKFYETNQTSNYIEWRDSLTVYYDV
jgi:hypothetical protein